MTRKDYMSFAELVVCIDDDGIREQMIQGCVDIFEDDNPRFDEEKFRNYIRQLIVIK